mgnify:CR=1 FL=1
MIDIKFLRENPDAVKENIKKKFQDYKLPLVDQVIELDEQSRAVKKQADELRSNRNKISKQIGSLMAQGKKEEGMALKEEVTKQAEQLAELEKQEADLSAKVTEIMMQIPNIIDPSVPIGKDDSQNVEIERFGDPLYLILKFLITQKLWKNSMVSTLILQERLRVTVSIILWAILQDFTQQ